MPVEVDVFSGLDESKFQAKLASARKAYEAAPKDPRLEAQVHAALLTEVAHIQDFAKANPDDEFAKANQHLLQAGTRSGPVAAAADALAVDTWHCGGSASLSGVVWWALGVTVMFPPPLSFAMGAKGGPDWSVAVFTSAIFGSFVVDPQSIFDSLPPNSGPLGGRKGPCKFQLGEISTGGAGAVRISFYSTSGTYWGLLGGIAPGIGGSSISGDGDMLWSG